MTIQVFPQLPGQGFWVSKGPSFKTTVKKAASGRQIRGTQQGQSIWQFQAGYKFLRDTISAAEIEALYAFFCGCAGQLNPFYLLDPFDNLPAGLVPGTNQPAQQQVGIGDGATTSFQLLRTVGPTTPYPFVEPVYGYVANPQVFLNNTLTTAFTQGTLGTITFNQAPAKGAVITWTGQFYFLCHFTDDAMTPVQKMANLWSLDGLGFESLIP